MKDMQKHLNILQTKLGTNKIRYKYFLKGLNTFNKDHTLSYQFSEGGKVFTYPNLSQKDY